MSEAEAVTGDPEPLWGHPVLTTWPGHRVQDTGWSGGSRADGGGDGMAGGVAGGSWVPRAVGDLLGRVPPAGMAGPVPAGLLVTIHTFLRPSLPTRPRLCQFHPNGWRRAAVNFRLCFFLPWEAARGGAGGASLGSPSGPLRRLAAGHW